MDVLRDLELHIALRVTKFIKKEDISVCAINLISFANEERETQ
jgi:hypothetical protein